MLVLSRKKNESIIINDDITIVVVEIRGDKVRLGFAGPLSFDISRSEHYERTKTANIESSHLTPKDLPSEK